MADKPYELVAESNAPPKWDDIRFKVRDEPPRDLSSIVGDCFHNFRSSLDHLAWQLALLTTPDPSWSTQFPIFREKPSTKRACNNWRRQTKDILPEAKALIERLQPYNRPYGRERDPLWIIHEGDRIDKHRAITPLGFRYRMPLSVPGFSHIFSGVINDGENIALAPPGADVKQDIEPNLEINIAFDVGDTPADADAPQGVTIDDLHHLNKAIRDGVFPGFDQFFPPYPPK